MNAILARPDWPRLAALMKPAMSPYPADMGPGGPRVRLNLPQKIDQADRDYWLAQTSTCANCGATIHFVRYSERRDLVYFAVSCTQDVNRLCSRSSRATKAYSEVEDALRAMPRQEPLFAGLE